MKNRHTPRRFMSYTSYTPHTGHKGRIPFSLCPIHPPTPVCNTGLGYIGRKGTRPRRRDVWKRGDVRDIKTAPNLYPANPANMATATFAKCKLETPTAPAATPPTTPAARSTTGAAAASRSAQQPNQQAAVGSYRQEANMATGAAARSTPARSRTTRQPAVRFRGIDTIAQNTPKTPQEREDENPTDEPTEREERATGQGRRQGRDHGHARTGARYCERIEGDALRPR